MLKRLSFTYLRDFDGAGEKRSETIRMLHKLFRQRKNIGGGDVLLINRPAPASCGQAERMRLGRRLNVATEIIEAIEPVGREPAWRWSDLDREYQAKAAFYVANQQMPAKSDAMSAWSEALVKAFMKAGGTMPVPAEGPRASKLRQKPPI